MTRVLTMGDLCRRVRALDAYYLSADRWTRRWIETGRADDRWRAHLAWRAYDRLRDTPYALADAPQEAP